MPAKEYTFEDRARAKELYLDGLTFAQVAKITGVSESQLKRWSAEEAQEESGLDWPDQRRKLRRDLTEDNRKYILLRRGLLDTGLELLKRKNLTPQELFAATNIANLLKSMPKEKAPEPPAGQEARVIKTPQDAVAAIEEVMQRQLNEMLLIPGKLTSQGLKDLLKIMEKVEELKARYRPAGEGEAAEMPPEGEAHRRLVAEVDKILGVK